MKDVLERAGNKRDHRLKLKETMVKKALTTLF